ncbi:anthranilate synthase component II [Lachnoclostridium edouardi]|uniref:anthranilate synthase component II n=1 Tax=Lachnoclostridium edouardi TaxID=1926283 RepID=UPI000C7DAAA8|nr:aminodeoxychorismate/anthranilate synthase component II [Lachnoclostridium edouardi]
MILLIDNYDSFSYNLYQLAGSLYGEIKVIRNDEMTVEEIKSLAPEGIILSPGPGRPSEAGCCQQVVKELGGKIPILGVCLGHQAICQAYGGKITYAKQLMHGKQSVVKGQGRLFLGLSDSFPVARYHSLAAEEESLPKELIISARTEDGEVMAVEHKEYAVYGLQFHPESILTPDGKKIIENFLEVVRND